MKHSRVPAPPRKLVIATGNAGKLREFRLGLEGLPFEVMSQSAFEVVPPPETGSSFMANALLKARHAAAVTGEATMADDSGLEVDALGGAPGIYSARFAGTGADDAANNAKLRTALAGVPMRERRARYRCALVFVEGPEDPEPLTAEGLWEGYILDAPRGSGGFGYDAYFWLPELELTAAELSPDEKNRRSHRGEALRSLRRHLAARQ
jgi:XTP/dITP diphosphohydrolase